MDDNFNFWHELYRRRVLRTTAVYAVIAFVVIQLIAGSADYFGWSTAIVRGAIWIAVIGAVVVAVVSWVYDFTPWGVLKTPARGSLPIPKTGLIDYRIEAVIIVVLLIAMGFAIRGAFDELGQLRAEEPGENVNAVQLDQSNRLVPPQTFPAQEKQDDEQRQPE